MRIDIKYPERFTAIFETVTGNKLHHPVLGITTDSREVQENDLYIALIGERVDGHSFLGNVENSGATAALVSQINESLGLQQIVCDNPLIMIGKIANAWRKQFDSVTKCALSSVSGGASITTTERSPRVVR